MSAAHEGSECPDRELSNDEVLESFRVNAMDLLINWSRQRTLSSRGASEEDLRQIGVVKREITERLQTLTPKVIELLESFRRDTSAIHDFQLHLLVIGDYSAAKTTWQQVTTQLSALRRDMERGAPPR